MSDLDLEGFDLGARRGGHDEGRPEPHVVRPLIEVDHGDCWPERRVRQRLACTSAPELTPYAFEGAHGHDRFGSGAELRLEPVRIRLRGKQPPRREHGAEQGGRDDRRRLGCKTAPHHTPYGAP